MAPKKKMKSDVDNATKMPAQSSRLPNWPVFSPMIPPLDLALQELLPEQIVTIPNFWTATLCKTKPKKGDAVRVNDRYQIDDATFAERLWSGTALRSLVTGVGASEDSTLRHSEEQRAKLWGGEVMGLNPNIRIYRYSKGQFFGQHYDDTNNVSMPGSPSVPAYTTWTLLIYLTSPSTGCIGGETVFYRDSPSKKSRDPPPSPIVIQLEVGMALLHRHGADCMLHEGREVLEGEKWVIRSDLCVKR